jgi:transposase
MRPPRSLPSSAEKKLTLLLDQVPSKEEYRRVLCVWLRAALGMPAAEIATVLGWSMGSVHNLHSQYLRGGPASLLGVGRGGRHRQLLSIEEEKKLLAAFAFLAEQGGVTEISSVRAALEQQVGQVIAPSTVYRLLARQGWRKLAPRPFHPDASLRSQEAFKKSYGVWCASRPPDKQNAAWRCG